MDTSVCVSYDQFEVKEIDDKVKALDMDIIQLIKILSEDLQEYSQRYYELNRKSDKLELIEDIEYTVSSAEEVIQKYTKHLATIEDTNILVIKDKANIVDSLIKNIDNIKKQAYKSIESL